LSYATDYFIGFDGSVHQVNVIALSKVIAGLVLDVARSLEVNVSYLYNAYFFKWIQICRLSFSDYSNLAAYMHSAGAWI